MGDVFEGARCRVNSAMLSRYIGSAVCFVGRVEKVHPTGTTFILSDGEGKHATIELGEPLEEEISGVLEVVGRVTPKATIMGMSYILFREEKTAFDLGLYNEALKVIHEFPQYYPFGAAGSN
ncbi:replication protein A 14 kDa subunit [Microcaecilia unicolor]|uniref:Replication protein A 14 kDa subunit n=1 Tax=Microcaecilia unicolor TaxID=1415580 RepID=A0A6P7Y1V0_9AMPH|nr:replication protein A 14 kDa subunit [Microcaecilia unicolor]